MFKDKMGHPLTLDQAWPKITNRVRSYFADFALMLIHAVYDLIPFHSLRNSAFILAGGRLGAGSTIHMGARFYSPAGITIGEDSIVGYRAYLDGRDRLVIGNHVDIASEVMIYNSEHDVNSADFHATNRPVEVGDYVFIGPRSVILPGIKIGRGSVIAAGAVVTKDVPDFAIVGGVPAKVIGQRLNKELHYRLGRARLFQ